MYEISYQIAQNNLNKELSFKLYRYIGWSEKMCF
jgi:hypothetical protein